MHAAAESSGAVNGHANGTAVLDRVRQAIEQADADRQPRPSQAQLAELVGVSRHHVRQALARLATEPADPSADDILEDAAEQQQAPPGNQHAAGSPAFTPVAPGKPPSRFPVVVISLAAAVAIWSGWVGLGQMCGFGPINLLPGIGGGFTLNSAIVLPISVEAYAAFALRVWLSTSYHAERTTRFARRSTFISLAVGGAAQVVYHLLAAAGWTKAPWPVTMLVSLVPVLVIGLAGTLAKLVGNDRQAGRQQ